MIAGTGVDIVDIPRIEVKIQKSGFIEKIFSKNEIEYCSKSARPAESYAARFAAKEAFLKATGRGLTLGYELHEIEITCDDYGKPSLVLTGNARKYFDSNNWTMLHVSLSHTDSVACAFVIIEK